MKFFARRFAKQTEAAIFATSNPMKSWTVVRTVQSAVALPTQQFHFEKTNDHVNSIDLLENLHLDSHRY